MTCNAARSHSLLYAFVTLLGIESSIRHWEVPLSCLTQESASAGDAGLTSWPIFISAAQRGYGWQARQKEAELAGSRAKAAEAALQEALLKRSNETEKGDALSSTLALVRKVQLHLATAPYAGIDRDLLVPLRSPT